MVSCMGWKGVKAKVSRVTSRAAGAVLNDGQCSAAPACIGIVEGNKKFKKACYEQLIFHLWRHVMHCTGIKAKLQGQKLAKVP